MYRCSKVTFSIYQGPFPHNLFYWDKENHSLYQGLHCIEVCYIEVLCYSPHALQRVSVFPVVGSTLCLGLGWWVDSFGLFPRLEGLMTYGEPHKSHLNGVVGSRRGTLRRGLSLLFLFFFVLNSSSGDWNLTGFLFLSRSLARLFSKSSAETFEAENNKTNKWIY